MAQLSGGDVIFSDDFSTNGPIDSAKWGYNVWTPPTGGGSFYGNTQQRQELPTASDGVMRLRLDTYNASDPNHTTFVGSEAISNRTFDLSAGPIAFEATVRYGQNQAGLIGGFFTFAGPPDHHDEIDFEAMSNSFNQIQTNIYHNAPLGEGDPISYPVTGSLSDFHTLRIEWLPNMVRWLVDGEVVRTESNMVPDKAMNLHFNIWGPPASWPTGSSSLQAASSQAQNQSFYFDVDSVKVEKLAALLGDANHENLVGTAASEFIDGAGGDDRIAGGGGNDFIEGGAGHNVALYSGAARHFTVAAVAGEGLVSVEDRSGAEGKDTLSNIQSVEFADHTFDLSSMLKAADLDEADLEAVIDLYTGYLDRAPDALGLFYWAAQVHEGLSITDLAKQFFASGESQALRPQGQSTTEFVSSSYTEILGRAADAGGLAYWVGEIESGRLDQDEFMLAFLRGAQSQSGSSVDAVTLADKTSMAAYYAIENGLNDGAGAKAVLDAVDVLTSRALTDSYADAAEAIDSGALITKLLGVHIGEYAGV